MLPEHRAARPEWDIANGGWEVKRIEAMLGTIKNGQTVFDIGTEEGDISALIAKYCDAKMVLVEPNDRVWPCIKAIWEANGLPMPLAFVPGFFSNKTTQTCLYQASSLWGGKMVADHGFKQLHENYPDVPQMKMDDWCSATGIYPDVITMDCEGAEFEVIKGGIETLKTKKPVIFMSIHPEFMFETYKHTGEWKEKLGEEKQWTVQLLRTVDECGYRHEIIEWDYHECHAAFYPL